MAEATFKKLATTAKFVKVECGDCGTPNTIFARATTAVPCSSCGVQIVETTGGLVKIHGSVSAELE